jgi:DNA adenine methylase
MQPAMLRSSGPRHADTAVRPILKWAGGKRQLLPELRRHYPRVFTRYVEPFLGSGAVFLDCHNLGLLDGREVRLSDVNADLIGCYRMIRDAVKDTIASLAALEGGHRRDGQRHFYEVRDARFNRLREAVAASGDPAGLYTPELAAMLIYLNRTGYNGLFRLNSRGAFNVPAGRYASPLICDADNLRRLSAALARPDLSLDVEPFERALSAAKEGDFIYLDPPYAPVSATARFTSYTADGFGTEEQTRLQQAVIRLAGTGAWILLSNSDTPDIRRMYADSPEAQQARLRARKVSARRAINSRASQRGAVNEYLITNVQ